MKTVLHHADFVIEGYVEPREPLRDEGPFSDHTGYYTLPESRVGTQWNRNLTPKTRIIIKALA